MYHTLKKIDIILFLSIFFLYGTLISQTPRDLAREALQHYEHSEIDSAVQKLQFALEMDSSYKEVYLMLGEILINNHQDKEAESLFRKGFHFFFDDLDLHMGLGSALLKQNRFKEASIHYKRVIELDKNRDQAFQWLAVCTLQLGIEQYNHKNYPKAISFFEQAAELDPEYVQPYRNLAILYGELNQLDKAKEVVESGLEIEPTERDLLQMHIQLLSQAGDFEEAMQAAELLHLTDTEIESALLLAYLYRFNNRIPDAEALYDELLIQFPKEKSIVDAYAEHLVNITQFDQAISLYHTLLKQTPSDRSIYQDIAKIHMTKGSYEEARDALRKCLTGKEEDVEIYLQIADCYQKEENTEQEIKTYLEALNEFKDHWELNKALGLAYETCTPDKAIPVYKTMQSIRANDPYGALRLGIVFDQLDSTQSAIRFFKAASQLNTQHPVAYYKLGEYFLAEKDTALAVDQTWKAVEKGLKQVKRIQGTLVSKLQSSQGGLNLFQLEELDKSAQELNEIQEIVDKGLSCLLEWAPDGVLEFELNDKIEKYNQDPNLLKTLGHLYSRQNKHGLALQTFRRALKTNVKNKDAHLGMGAIYEKTGQSSQAVLAYRRAHISDKEDPVAYESLIRLYANQGNMNQLADDWLLQARSGSAKSILVKYLMTILEQLGRTLDLKEMELRHRELTDIERGNAES